MAIASFSLQPNLGQRLWGHTRTCHWIDARIDARMPGSMPDFDYLFI